MLTLSGLALYHALTFPVFNVCHVLRHPGVALYKVLTFPIINVYHVLILSVVAV